MKAADRSAIADAGNALPARTIEGLLRQTGEEGSIELCVHTAVCFRNLLRAPEKICVSKRCIHRPGRRVAAAKPNGVCESRAHSLHTNTHGNLDRPDRSQRREHRGIIFI